MRCVTCNHDCQPVGNGGPPRYWCPRCGTLHHWGVRYCQTHDVPLLVERCRDFEDGGGSARELEFWVRLGIARAIRKPEDRVKLPQRKAA